MAGPGVDEALEQLTALHRRTLELFVERRRQRGPQAPTRLQEQLLLAIRERGAMRTSEIGPLLEIGSATTSQFLRALEGKGWVIRSICPDDRRRHEVRLTAQGRAAVAEGEERRRAALVRVLAGLTAEERGQLLHLAGRVATLLTPEAASERQVR